MSEPKNKQYYGIFGKQNNGEPVYGFHCIDLLHKNVDQAEFERILLGIENPLKITYITAEDNKIIRIKGLDRFPNLERLNLNQNQIRKIEGLDNNTKLKGIHLGWNQIQKLEGLDKLVNLEWIYLPKNQISKIEGLKNNINLNELLLQDNQINTTDGMDVFFKLTKLKKVVLSRNPIKSPGMKYITIGGVRWDTTTNIVLRNIFMEGFMALCQDLRKELEITRNIKPKHIKYDQKQKIINQYKKYEKYVELLEDFEGKEDINFSIYKDIKESYNIFKNQFLTIK